MILTPAAWRGTFFPYWDRIHDGGLKEFRAAMRQNLPAGARRCWPGYFRGP